MKKRVWIAVILIFLLSAGTVLAAESIEPFASGQISSYTIAIDNPSGTLIRITADVDGTHSKLTRIGFSSITIYKRVTGSTGGWSIAEEYGQSYALNTGYHKYVVTHAGTRGYEYYAAANVYAEDTLGYTARSMTSSMYDL